MSNALILNGPAPSGRALSASNITLVGNEAHTLAWKMQAKVDHINGASGSLACPWGPDLNVAADNGGGTGRKIDPVVSVGALGALTFQAFTSGGVTPSFTGITQNGGTAGGFTLGPNGTIYNWYFHYDTISGTSVLTIYDSTGTTQLYTSSQTVGSTDTLVTGANGFVNLGVDELSNAAMHTTVPGFALYNRILTGAAQGSKPTSADVGLIDYWGLEDASSGTSPTFTTGVNGNVLNLSNNYVWGVAGSWDLVNPFGKPRRRPMIFGRQAVVRASTW